MQKQDFDEKATEYIEKYRGKIKFAGPKHARIKQINALQTNSKPNPKKLVVIEGIWAHERAMQYNLKIEAFLFNPELIYSLEAERIVEHFVKNANDSYLVSGKVFSKIAEKSNSNGLVSICYLPIHALDDIPLKDKNIVVILDGLEIPGNIGTIMRSVDGAGGDAIIICNHRARLTHPKLVRSSHGTNLKLPIVEADVNDTIKWLQDNKFNIVLTDTRAIKSYNEHSYEGRVAIVAGSERYGITKEWYKHDNDMISIPMRGDNDSLNVAIATTIILYEVSMKQFGNK